MFATGLISFGLLALLGLFALPQIPRLWRDENNLLRSTPILVAWGNRGWSAWVRTWPRSWNIEIMARLTRAERMNGAMLGPDQILDIGQRRMVDYGIDGPLVPY